MKTKYKILVGGLIVIISLLSWFSIQSRIELKSERDSVAYYSNLAEERKISEGQLKVRYDSISSVLQRYKYIVDSLETIVETNATQIKYLNKELNNAMEELKYTTSLSDYEWLKTRYMFEANDTLKFVFHGGEVKAITKDVVNGLYLDSLYTAHLDIAILKEAQLAYKDEMINTLSTERDNSNLVAQELSEQLAIKAEELQLSEAEVSRIKKALRMWQGGALGTGAFIVLALLLL